MNTGDGLLYFVNKYNLPQGEAIMKIAEIYKRELGNEKYNELLGEIQHYGRKRAAEIVA